MLLAVDIGNTHVVMGIFEKNALRNSWRFSSNASRTEDECWGLVHSLAETDGIDLQCVSGCAISSVVPNLTLTFKSMIFARLGLESILVNASLPLGLKIHYDSPSNVGADRICNAIAGFEKYGGPLIVVDFGTATTFDVISEHGDYLGGIIAPGIETSLQTLHHRAALLMNVALTFPERAIGTSTETSMQSGLMYGAVDMVNGLIRRIREECGGVSTVIATGGLASAVAPKIDSLTKVEPQLTLYGLNRIYQQLRREDN